MDTLPLGARGGLGFYCGTSRDLLTVDTLPLGARGGLGFYCGTSRDLFNFSSQKSIRASYACMHVDGWLTGIRLGNRTPKAYPYLNIPIYRALSSYLPYQTYLMLSLFTLPSYTTPTVHYLSCLKFVQFVYLQNKH